MDHVIYRIIRGRDTYFVITKKDSPYTKEEIKRRANEDFNAFWGLCNRSSRISFYQTVVTNLDRWRE